MRFRSRAIALAMAFGVVALGAGFVPITASAAGPLVIGVDNASPSGHNYMYVTFYPKTGVTVHGKDVVDFHWNPGSIDGFHTVTLAKQPDSADATRAALPTVIPDADDGAGSLIGNPAVFGPSDPVCGHTALTPCSYTGAAVVNSGAIPTISDNHFFVALNVTAPVTVNFLCLLHPGMQSSLNVVDVDTSASTQLQLDTASATQYAADTAAGNAAEAAANSAGTTTNADGTKTYSLTAGTAAPDVEVLEMLPSSVSIHVGDKVKWTTTTLVDIHTVTFPNDATSKPLDPLAPTVCEAGPPDTAAPDPTGPPAFGCADPTQVENPIVPQPQGPTTLAGPTTVASSGIVSVPNGAPFPDNYTFTFAAAGTYTYLCRIHDHMVGSVLAAAVVVPTLPAAGAAPQSPRGPSSPWTAVIVLVAVAAFGFRVAKGLPRA